MVSGEELGGELRRARLESVKRIRLDLDDGILELYMQTISVAITYSDTMHLAKNALRVSYATFVLNRQGKANAVFRVMEIYQYTVREQDRNRLGGRDWHTRYNSRNRKLCPPNTNDQGPYIAMGRSRGERIIHSRLTQWPWARACKINSRCCCIVLEL